MCLHAGHHPPLPAQPTLKSGTGRFGWSLLLRAGAYSLYEAGGRLHYVEGRFEEGERSYHLVALEASEHLRKCLLLAKDGARFDDFVNALVDPEISREDAEHYVDELIRSQILVSGLAPAVTGPEPIHDLVSHLNRHDPTLRLPQVLDQVRVELADIDTRGVGVEPQRYRDIARRLEALPAKAHPSTLFQVDMIKPAADACLGQAVVAEILRGVLLLHHIQSRPLGDPLARFREAFVARYETREVSLVEALDDEVGIGFDNTAATETEVSPLLDGLAFPGVEESPAVSTSSRVGHLARKLEESLRQGSREILLGEEDLRALQAAQPAPLPDSFAVMAALAAASEEALASGDFVVLLKGVSGPSGAALVGRFCHASSALSREVETYLRLEEAHAPDAVYAEVVHLPEGREGNVLLRPVLRSHEIPFLGRSGAPAEHQIPVTDLRVSVSGGRIVLRSAHLDREIVPRLTSAHNFTQRSLGLYRFLCSLQSQGVTGRLAWSWGAFDSLSFLPRVTSGRLVLSLARWKLSRQELGDLRKLSGPGAFCKLQQWRAARRLPRLVALADGDNELPIDLDNVLSVDTFLHLVKGRDEARLVELFGVDQGLCVRGPEGRFVHELIVPFVKRPQEARPREARDRPRSVVSGLVQRRFPPGSEWLYAKLYTGIVTTDRLLVELVRPLVSDLQGAGWVDRWFFVRYGDPDWHLRLRLHGVPAALQREVAPAMFAAIGPCLEDGRVWRVQVDTYDREVERYGGPEGMGLAEALFHIDSETVVEMLARVPWDEDPGARWLLALRGIELLFMDLGLDADEVRSAVESSRAGYALEMRADRRLEQQLGERFRRDRKKVEGLFNPLLTASDPLAVGLELLRRRSERLKPVVVQMREGCAAARLSRSLKDLAASFAHMYANRLLRSSQRAHEFVIHDFLLRLYASQRARIPRTS